MLRTVVLSGQYYTMKNPPAVPKNAPAAAPVRAPISAQPVRVTQAPSAPQPRPVQRAVPGVQRGAAGAATFKNGDSIPLATMKAHVGRSVA